MGKKGQTFGSFADAAEALKKLKCAPGAAQHRRIDPRAKPNHSHTNGFADVEAAMKSKAEGQVASAPPKAKRQEFEVRPTGRGRSNVVPVETAAPLPHQIKAGLLPKRPLEERKKPELSSPIAMQGPPAALPPPKAEAVSGKKAANGKARLPLLPNLIVAKPKRVRHPVERTPTVPVAPSPPPPPTTKQLIERIRVLFGEAPPPIEARPQRALPWVRTGVEECIAFGAEVIRAKPEPDHSGYIIGCDFGTSSIKLAVRQPYRAGNPTAARPAPNLLQSNRHPYLWQSVIWFSPDTQEFSLLPGKGKVALEGFKAGILAGGGGKRILPDLAVTRNEAAAAFLALQLAHCLGWYGKTLPLGGDAARNVLAINIGIPVAAQDDTKTYRDFRHIVSAARALMPHATCLTHSKVRECYQASTHDLPAGFDLVPELTAAISGYANEPFARDGAHILIDVGASTLDVVAFNLVNRERVAAFAAEVNLLGAAALEAARGDGFPDDLFRRACIEQYDQVFNYARHPRVAPRNFDATLRRNPVQLMAIGGGCKTAVHKEFIARVHPTLGDLKLMHPSPPAQMTSIKCDTSRLLLAYGLTSDIPEQLELRRPSEIPLINDQQSAPISFISKDDV
ncbi:hypothetical protein [Sphingobium phenoxybenzoativorans]|uniref:hypothetical protein n=1 Tax=Sphingobium phenoxybenzoativorans TaxID=1592790 RepID=UPI000872DC9C|nr:hypothetical protein [Sphingobium phenoxybenzoativorans]